MKDLIGAVESRARLRESTSVIEFDKLETLEEKHGLLDVWQDTLKPTVTRHEARLDELG